MGPRSSVAALFLASCAATSPFTPVMAEIVDDLKDDVAALMGTEVEILEVTVRPLEEAGSSQHVFGRCSKLVRGDERAALIAFDPKLAELPPDAWRAIAAHELAHAHAVNEWGYLPVYLEEGLCDMIAVMTVPGVEAKVRKIRGRKHSFWLDHAQSLGIDGVRDLSQRAAGEGLAEIPDSWLPRCLPDFLEGPPVYEIDWLDGSETVMDVPSGEVWYRGVGVVPYGAKSWILRPARHEERAQGPDGQ